MNRFFWLTVCAWCVLGHEAEGQVSRRRVLLPAATANGVSRIETGVFLGVLSVRAPEELAAQLGLAAGFGLMVEAILPGSPAEKAGLKRHDVLLAFDDQELVNPEQLLALVRRSQKGQKVELTVMSQAVRKEVSVELDAGPVEIVASALDIGEATQAAIPAELLAGQEEVDTAAPSPQAKRMVRRDDSGEYALSIDDETMTFLAAPKEGEGGSWPVNTDAQKRVVPERYQEKLRGLFEWLEKVPETLPKVGG